MQKTKTAASLLIIAVLSVSSQDLGFGFSLKYVRMCLKPEFTRQLATDDGAIEIACATACAKLGASCQGFQLTVTGGGSAACQAFMFDGCSHMVRTDCSQFVWAFVRNQAGLPDGQLCPDGFGSGYFGSAYKMVSATSWTDGLNKCSSMPGLTKYADAIDANETAHMHWIKTNVNSGASMFIGGWRPGSSASDPWFWKSCSTGVSPQVWGVGQPNEGALANRMNIWSTHTAGADDLADNTPGVNKALCKCIDPFV